MGVSQDAGTTRKTRHRALESSGVFAPPPDQVRGFEGFLGFRVWGIGFLGFRVKGFVGFRVERFILLVVRNGQDNESCYRIWG